jgi:hypothetical protein
MERIVVSEEKAKKCRCLDCATFKLQGLEGGVFCANGPSAKMDSVPRHNGCDCGACPIRAEGDFAPVLFCMMASDTNNIREMDVEPVHADILVDTVKAAGTQTYSGSGD